MLRKVLSIWCLLVASGWGFRSLMAQSYWQQEVDYLIQVELDPVNKALHGHIIMHYTNRSPQTLPFIYMHLMPNAYSSPKSALNAQLLANDNQSLHFTNPLYRGYIDSLRWLVNGDSATIEELRDTMDIQKLVLDEPLEPGGTLRIETPFYLKLPSTHISRLGYKDNAYYLTQWYPKPAVYDVTGWHPMSYLDKGEFYSEFGNYEVHITVPKNYVVVSTGELMNPEEKLALDTLAAFTSQYVYPKKRKAQYFSTDPLPSQKTLVFRMENVHDFAFCVDPELLLLNDTAHINGRQIQFQTYVKRQHLDVWRLANKYAIEAMEFYTKEIGEYPHNHYTIVDVDDITGGDMEYPTLGFVGHSYTIEESIVHELGHTWFYSTIANNERDEHWMDEGLVTFYEGLYFSRKFPDNKIHFYAEFLNGDMYPYYQQSHTEYYALARNNKDKPTQSQTHVLSEENYYVQSYSKPAAFIWHLYQSFGADTFRTIMHDYYSLWKYKHPSGSDLQETFRNYVGDRADWFFDQAVISNEKIDYVVKDVRRKGDELVITIENHGEVNAPVFIETYNSDSLIQSYRFEPITKRSSINIPFDANIQWIVLDKNMSLPDVHLKNNYVRIKNGKKTSKPLRLNYFTSFENPNRKHLYYLPVMSFNLYDGLLAGMAFHNHGLLPKKTEWFIIPMFGVWSRHPAYYASISHTHYLKLNNPDRFVFRTTSTCQSYNSVSGTPLWYFQLSPHFKFIFERRNIHSPLVHEAGMKNQFIVQHVDPGLLLNSRYKFLMQNLLYYKINFKKRLWKIENTTSLEHVYDFGINYNLAPLSSFAPALKIYNELKIDFTYYKQQSNIQLRIFAGTFFFDPSMVTDTRFRLSGWTGNWDYAFTEYYMGRSETSPFFNQQTAHADGDFKINTFVGQTNKWMIAANLEMDIPMIYAGGYIDIATYSGAGSTPGSQPLAYNIGLYLKAPNKILQVYFPLVASSDIASSVDLNTNSYWERIRFTIQLKNIQIINAVRKLFI